MKHVIVIGGGHNGLVAAASLADIGHKVLLLEQSETLGGLCREEEFHPGYRCSVLQETGLFAPRLVRELRLQDDGLQYAAHYEKMATSGNGVNILYDPDPQAGVSLTGVEPGEQTAYQKFSGFVDRVRPALLNLLEEPPPPLWPRSTSDFLDLGSQGLRLRRIGQSDMLELTRVLPMSVWDWLEEHFKSPLLAEVLALDGVKGGFVGPRAAGTAANLLLHLCRAGRPLKGGPGALVRALEANCRRRGVEIKTGHRVDRICLRGGRASHVDLSSGERFAGDAFVATCDPRLTLLGMLRPNEVPLEVEDEIRNFRARGIAAKLHLALSAPLQIGTIAEGSYRFRLGGGDLASLERAFDSVKYRALPERFHFEITTPSLNDPSLAPSGHQVASVLVHCVPFDLEGGWTDRNSAQLQTTLLKQLAQWDPAFPEKLVSSELLTPPVLAERFSLTGGHLWHGEHALDQLLMLRPGRRLSRYKTPIPGLFLGGSGSHPGGGVTGLPGRLAALAVE